MCFQQRGSQKREELGGSKKGRRFHYSEVVSSPSPLLSLSLQGGSLQKRCAAKKGCGSSQKWFLPKGEVIRRSSTREGLPLKEGWFLPRKEVFLSRREVVPKNGEGGNPGSEPNGWSSGLPSPFSPFSPSSPKNQFLGPLALTKMRPHPIKKNVSSRGR